MENKAPIHSTCMLKLFWLLQVCLECPLRGLPPKKKSWFEKKTAKSGARKAAVNCSAAKKPATPSHASSDSMGTTLVLGGVSPHFGAGCDDDQGTNVVALSQMVFPLPDDVIPTALPGPLPAVDLVG